MTQYEAQKRSDFEIIKLLIFAAMKIIDRLTKLNDKVF